MWPKAFPTELLWAAGLLVVGLSPPYCVYQLYLFQQDGKISTKENTDSENMLLENRRPSIVLPPVPEEPSAVRKWIHPHAAAEAVSRLMDGFNEKSGK